MNQISGFKTTPLIPCQRHLFDIPAEVVYLNCAYMSPLMHSVVAAGQNGVARKAQPWRFTPEDFFSESDLARELFARIINTRAEDIAIVPSVSYGIGIAATNLTLEKHQHILLLDEQFPSNVYPWRQLAGQCCASVISVTASHNQSLSNRVLESIGPNTAIVALPHCRWTDGALLDLVAIGRRCREVGAALVLDVTQSAGALPFDVQAVDPDFLVAACYKWLLGPYSLGFTYVAPRWQQSQPLEQTWLSRAGSEDFSRLVDYQESLQSGAIRFDMGERSNFHLMPMATTAMKQILDWGIDNIAFTLQSMTGKMTKLAHESGLTYLPESERPGHYLGIGFPGGIPGNLLPELAAAGVYLSVRGNSMRITPHVFNNDDDIDRLFVTLRKFLTSG